MWPALHVENLADVAIGAGPDQLVAPGLVHPVWHFGHEVSFRVERRRRKSRRNIGRSEPPEAAVFITFRSVRARAVPISRSLAITSAPPLRFVSRFFQRRSDAREELLAGPIRGELLGAEHLADRARAIAAGQRLARRPAPSAAHRSADPARRYAAAARRCAHSARGCRGRRDGRRPRGRVAPRQLSRRPGAHPRGAREPAEAAITRSCPSWRTARSPAIRGSTSSRSR